MPKFITPPARDMSIATVLFEVDTHFSSGKLTIQELNVLADLDSVARYFKGSPHLTTPTVVVDQSVDVTKLRRNMQCYRDNLIASGAQFTPTEIIHDYGMKKFTVLRCQTGAAARIWGAYRTMIECQFGIDIRNVPLFDCEEACHGRWVRLIKQRNGKPHHYFYEQFGNVYRWRFAIAEYDTSADRYDPHITYHKTDQVRDVIPPGCTNKTLYHSQTFSFGNLHAKVSSCGSVQL